MDSLNFDSFYPSLDNSKDFITNDNDIRLLTQSLIGTFTSSKMLSNKRILKVKQLTQKKQVKMRNKIFDRLAQNKSHFSHERKALPIDEGTLCKILSS